MPRSPLASITLTTGLFLTGYWAFAQEAGLPAFTKVAPVPLERPVEQFIAAPAGGYVRSVPAEFPVMVADESTRNRDRELSRQTNALVEKYGQTKEAKDKSDVEKELAKVVADHFALRQDLREKELQDLEDQVKRLRAVHQQRSAEKERIVTDRVQQLLRESTGLGWGNDSPSPRNDVLYYTNSFNSVPRPPVPLAR